MPWIEEEQPHAVARPSAAALQKQSEAARINESPLRLYRNVCRPDVSQTFDHAVMAIVSDVTDNNQPTNPTKYWLRSPSTVFFHMLARFEDAADYGTQYLPVDADDLVLPTHSTQGQMPLSSYSRVQ